jgi:hypothetical protein
MDKPKRRKGKQEETKRPFRLWDTKANAFLPWRCYSTAFRAVRAGVVEINWSPTGTTIEVVDVRTSKLYVQFTATPTGIRVFKQVEVKRETQATA